MEVGSQVFGVKNQHWGCWLIGEITLNFVRNWEAGAIGCLVRPTGVHFSGCCSLTWHPLVAYDGGRFFWCFYVICKSSSIKSPDPLPTGFKNWVLYIF